MLPATAQDGMPYNALPARSQCVRSRLRASCTDPPAALVAYAKYSSPARITKGSAKSNARTGDASPGGVSAL